jgi:uracil-DNA glycosylase
MQNRDSYKLLYNNLWLYKTGNTNNEDGNKQSVHEVHEHPSQQHDAVVSDKDQGSVRGLIYSNQLEVQKNNEQQSLPLLANEQNHESVCSSRLTIDNWDILVDSITNCSKCNLCHARQNVVIERGSRTAKWMFVGEGPGEQEDIQGKPFVGASGQLLQKMIAAMQLDPATDVYICNVVKCRPPSNRNPEANEIELCKNYLFSQIELVKPQVIITLGRFAYQTLLNTNVALGKLRLKQHYYKDIPLVVTYHPAYLLRNPSAKKDAWADLQLAMQIFKDKNYDE